MQQREQLPEASIPRAWTKHMGLVVEQSHCKKMYLCDSGFHIWYCGEMLDYFLRHTSAFGRDLRGSAWFLKVRGFQELAVQNLTWYAADIRLNRSLSTFFCSSDKSAWRSGWWAIASFRNAVLISSIDAVLPTPSSLYKQVFPIILVLLAIYVLTCNSLLQ